MKCFFDKEKECLLPTNDVPLVKMAGFCQACLGGSELAKAFEDFKIMKAQLILHLLQIFPKDEEKAKEEYRKLMKRVEEW